MKAVFDFVQGKLSYDEFEIEFILHPEIWDWIQALVPENIAEADCSFRMQYSNMQGFETNLYNVKATIVAFGYDDFYGRSVAYHLISALVRYHYPEVVCREPPQKGSDDVLEKLKLDYIGGAEVDDIVKDTIWMHQKEGKTAIKKALKEQFHISGRKHPQWVQEPEWPAVDGKPMMFVSQRNVGDQFVYEFADVDTKEIRCVIQYM